MPKQKDSTVKGEQPRVMHWAMDAAGSLDSAQAAVSLLGPAGLPVKIPVTPAACDLPGS